jgi:hypothetical protein
MPLSSNEMIVKTLMTFIRHCPRRQESIRHPSCVDAE